jgi:hypothetical protein
MSQIAKIAFMAADGDYAYSSVTGIEDVDTGERDRMKLPGGDIIYDRYFMSSIGSVIMYVPDDDSSHERAQFYQVMDHGLETLYGYRAVRRVLAGGTQPTVAETYNCRYQDGSLSIPFRDTAGGDNIAEYLVWSVEDTKFEMYASVAATLDVDEDGRELLARKATEFLLNLSEPSDKTEAQ